MRRLFTHSRKRAERYRELAMMPISGALPSVPGRTKSEQALLEAGEQSGTLRNALRGAAEIAELDAEAERGIRRRILPMLLFLTAFAYAASGLLVLYPKFYSIFEQVLGTTHGGGMLILIAIGMILLNILLVLGLVAILLLGLGLLRKFPGTERIARSADAAKFATAMAQQLAAGVPHDRALIHAQTDFASGHSDPLISTLLRKETACATDYHEAAGILRRRLQQTRSTRLFFMPAWFATAILIYWCYKGLLFPLIKLVTNLQA